MASAQKALEICGESGRVIVRGGCLRERSAAAVHAVKPLPARGGRLAGQAGHAARRLMEPATEALHAIDPGFAADPQPL
jgi:hypothetical protein